MRVYRVAKTKYATDLSGFGAFLYGGRWNDEGIHVLYTSTSRPLALLELLVHTNAHRIALSQFTLLELDIPDEWVRDCYKLSLNILEGKSTTRSASLSASQFDDTEVGAISVASAILPKEINILLNPKAGNYSELKIVDSYILQVDSRPVY